MSVHRRNNQYTQHNIFVTIRNIFTTSRLKKHYVTTVEVIHNKRYTTTMSYDRSAHVSQKQTNKLFTTTPIYSCIMLISVGIMSK